MDHPRSRGSTVKNPADTKYNLWEWSRGYIMQALTVIFLFPIMWLLNGRKLPAWITRKLLLNHKRTTLGRKMDVRIPGDKAISPYMMRWWKIMRNWALNCYYHIVLRSDDDTAHHDHPWWSFSIVLDGGYFEERILPGGIHQRKWYGPGSMLFRRTGKTAHRLVLAKVGGLIGGPSDEKPATTIFITGPVLRRWGFHHTDQWVDAYEWDNYCQARGLAGHKMSGYSDQLAAARYRKD